MKIIAELEKKLELSTSRIKLAKKQLTENESGKTRLSFMVVASTELCIERNTFLVNKYKYKLKKLQKLEEEDLKELEEYEKNKEVIRENNYFKYQPQRIKRTKNKSDKEIAAALSTLKDIPEDNKLEDHELFEISHKSLELCLDIHSDLDDDLIEIKSEFLELIEGNFNDVNNELKLLNYRIPIIILQLRILLKNIRENIKESKLEKNKFTGFPKFEDWWIHEMWTSHQAYMGLFKWKQIILDLCISSEEKRAFEAIFKNWILVKKMLNVKGVFAYFYNYAFDEMIAKYAELEAEEDESNLNSMKVIVEKLTKNENFVTVSTEHNIVTPYMKFKIEKQMENNKDTKDKR